ncbi:hypothetical protein ACH4TS_32575 [Streptomyces albidoflavus]
MQPFPQAGVELGGAFRLVVAEEVGGDLVAAPVQVPGEEGVRRAEGGQFGRVGGEGAARDGGVRVSRS